MGFLDRLFGRKEEPQGQAAAPTYTSHGDREYQPPNADEQALQRYRYMLRTAPPETIEQAHEEAFAKLTPTQRGQALRELAAETPEGERAALGGGRDDPKTLARLATRSEIRQPGSIERIFGGTGRGPGMGGMGGTLLGSLAAGFVGSIIAQQFLSSIGDDAFGEGDTSEQSGNDETDNTGDDSGDYGSDDYGSGDFGGGDFGGGDFGGGF